MKKTLLIFSWIFLSSTIAKAEYYYDYQTGNSYYTNSHGGNTQVRGFNSRTGSSWNSNIQSNGNISGFNSKGNYWNYNRNTGSYYNSNGTTCFGKGYTRVCN